MTESLFEFNADDIIRQQCRAREEAERHERTIQKKLAESAETITAQAETIEQQSKTIQKQEETIKNLTSKCDALQSSYNNLQSSYNDLKNIVTALQKQLNIKVST